MPSSNGLTSYTGLGVRPASSGRSTPAGGVAPLFQQAQRRVSSSTFLNRPLVASKASRLLKDHPRRFARTQPTTCRASATPGSRPMRSWTAWAWGIRYRPMATASAIVSDGMCSAQGRVCLLCPARWSRPAIRSTAPASLPAQSPQVAVRPEARFQIVGEGVQGLPGVLGQPHHRDDGGDLGAGIEEGLDVLLYCSRSASGTGG